MSPHESKPNPREPVPLHARAMDNLSYIRGAIEAAGSFTAVSGRGQAVVGLTALLAAWIAARQSSRESWILVWVAEALLTILISAFAIAVKARAARLPLFTGAARKFMVSFGLPIAAGALAPPPLLHSSASERIPGLWLLLYGTGIVTGGLFSVAVVPVMGFCFILLGVAGLYGPTLWNDALMA